MHVYNYLKDFKLCVGTYEVSTSLALMQMTIPLLFVQKKNLDFVPRCTSISHSLLYVTSRRTLTFFEKAFKMIQRW